MSPRRLARMTDAARSWYLAEIAYLADRNPAAAKVSARMREARRTLAEHPRIGTAGTVAGTRRLVVGPYVLSFRQRGDVVEIIDIRHGRQIDKNEV